MSGNLMMASNQLQLALTLPGLDPVQRARFSARLEEVRAAMPKKNQGHQSLTIGSVNSGQLLAPAPDNPAGRRQVSVSLD